MAHESIVLGGGCFWCLEAVFAEVDGVLRVESGYAGGVTPFPDFEAVCSGRTGHAEVVRVAFDPERVALEQLLAIFFGVHDPTTPNRQGHDVGSQYRSIILVADERQAGIAHAVIDDLTERQVFEDPVVTEVTWLRSSLSDPLADMSPKVALDAGSIGLPTGLRTGLPSGSPTEMPTELPTELATELATELPTRSLTAFYPAEGFHHRYFERHPDQGYCRAVISPRVAAFRRAFASSRRGFA